MDPQTPAPPTPSKLFRFAAVISLIGAGGFGWCAAQQVNLTRDLRAGLDEATLRTELLERNAARTRRALEDTDGRATILAAPDLRSVTLEAQPGAGGASGRAFWSPTRGVVVAASGIPPTPTGRVYQLWFVRSPSSVNAGLLRVDGVGRIFETIAVPVDSSLPIAIAITNELQDGADTPTGDVLLLGRTDR